MSGDRGKHDRGADAFEVAIGEERLVVISLPANEVRKTATLSPTELAVARDALAGLSNAAIAHKRGRSSRTIANQLASIYRKLGVGSRAQMATRLLGRGRPARCAP
jgi:DNA-binding NarL/FixJ family response regulator